MRARLGRMQQGEKFQFICAADMAEKMGRVVSLAGGMIDERKVRPEGTVITVLKAQ